MKNSGPASPGHAAAQAPRSPAAVSVTSITVKPGRAVFKVYIPDERFRYTNSTLAQVVEQRFPTVPEHACVNGIGRKFGSVIAKTSVPHLLEHLTIDSMVRESSTADALFVGTTEWLDEVQGIAEIQLSYADDLQVLRTFNEALQFVNMAVLP